MPLQRKTLCCGWTGAEIRMWLSLSGALALGMMAARVMAGMDYFRICFFTSPMLAVVVLGPMQRDKRLYKLLFYSGGAFVVYWLTMQSYPTQCRHAWGTRMISDTTFWGESPQQLQAQQDAIMKEKDNFYVLKDVTDKEDQAMFVGGTNKTRVTPTAPPPGESIDTVWGILQSARNAKENAADHNLRIHKWLAPLTAGGSLNILKLRAYCNLHIVDMKVPHVYPLRVLGLETDWAVPCPYWSCLLTEAHAGGKQIFWIIVAIVGAVNFVHYRMDCACCQWWFGSGTPRVFWSWMWATLLPFLTVLMIKTTVDDEIGIIIGVRVRETERGFVEFISTTRHQIYVGVASITALLVYIYWEKVRDALGIPEHPLAQCFLSRSSGGQEASDERTFQICVWRIDMHRDSNTAADPSSPSGGASDSDGEYSQRQSSRSFLFGNNSSPSKFSLMKGGLFGREEDQDTLRTHDGRRPTIVVRFYYGSKEIQKTRAVRPTQSEWNNKVPVFIQENFRCVVPFRPGTPLRVEVQDTGAPLGTVSIGEVSFDEQKLKRQFEDSRRTQRDASQVPVHQVIKMLEAAGGRGVEKDQAAVKQLRTLGFVSHMLSDGGTIWLAFCETDLAQQEASQNLLCCGGA